MEVFLNGFMQRAFQASALIAILAPILGLTLILRRQSLLADTLSHVSLAGVALGLLVGVNPTATTIAVVIIVAILMEYLRTVFRGYSEISVAILMSSGMAVALLLMSVVSGRQAASIDQFLFGSIITINNEQILTLLLLTVALVILYVVFRRPLYVLLFDEDTAHTAGLPVRMMSVFISCVTGVAISVIMPITGTLLVSAILILPAAIAMRLVNRFSFVIWVGMGVGLIGMFGGLFASYEFGTPPGATIAMVFIVLFVLANTFKSIRTKQKSER